MLIIVIDSLKIKLLLAVTHHGDTCMTKLFLGFSIDADKSDINI